MVTFTHIKVKVLKLSDEASWPLYLLFEVFAMLGWSLAFRCLKGLPRHRQPVWSSTASCSVSYARRCILREICANPRSYASQVSHGRIWSAEQLAIIARVRTHNVIVSARPGSGKTATAEAIVSSNLDKKVAVLTYSKRLQLETEKRLREYPNCDIYTFHGMAGELFSRRGKVRDDLTISRLRSSRAQPNWTGKLYDIIVLDEMQDCTPVLFWLLCLFITCVTRARGHAPRLVVLGDERQAIFEFRGADERFLRDCPITMADLSPDAWERMTLTKSFRLSHQNARFINKAFLGGEGYVVGSHNGPKPLYFHTNPSLVGALAKKLAPLIHRYGVEQTAILGTTVRTNNTISKLTNHFTDKYKMPIAEPMSDDMTLDELVIQGKLCVSTIHQFKGSERDLIILYGLDDFYFKNIAKDQPDDICPNNMFVALSRARKQLVVIHNIGQMLMPFVDIPKLQETAIHHCLLPHTDLSFVQLPPRKPSEERLNLPPKVFASEIARHVPDETLDAIISRYANTTMLSAAGPPSKEIQAPDKVITNYRKGHYEAVSDINGLVVVAAYELELRKSLTTLRSERGAPARPRLLAGSRDIASWLCRRACNYLSELSTYKSRKKQMEHHAFDWLEPYLTAARDRLQQEFSTASRNNMTFEFELSSEFHVKCEANKSEALGQNSFQKTLLAGRADIIQKHSSKLVNNANGPNVTLWEIKFVRQLSLEHIIQACVYAHLWSMKHGGKMPRIMLYNVRDGAKLEISPKDPTIGMEALVEEVLRAKYSSLEVISDDEFLEQCAKTSSEVKGLFHD